LAHIPEQNEYRITHPRRPVFGGDKSGKEMKEYICTSREMAERLKEAGYPKPAMEVIGYMAFWPEGCFFYRQGVLLPSGGFIFDEGDIYAPTALEIIPNDWDIKRYWDMRPDGTEINGWEARNEDEGVFFLNENPHDAAAMAWLWEKGNGQ
jgi:hypothetical protein